MPRPSDGVLLARLRGRSRRPPASYRPGALLDRLGRDLTGYRLERLAPDRARCLPVGQGPSFLAVERTERHAFMGVTTSAFRLDAGGPPGDARIRLRHTGAVRRTGVIGAVASGGGDAQRMLARLLDDPGFVAAATPLDCTAFTVFRDADGWHAEIALMGGAEVAMRLPPSRSYVRLSADQRDALVATFAAVDRLLP